MAAVDHTAPGVLVWFEDGARGRRALAQASVTARIRSAPLTVLAVAAHERVIGCGRCLQGTVLWNVEMKKIAVEHLTEARRLLGDPDGVCYELVVGDVVSAIVTAAECLDIGTVVLPLLRTGRLGPPERRNVRDRVAAAGPWQVVVAQDDPRESLPRRRSPAAAASATRRWPRASAR